MPLRKLPLSVAPKLSWDHVARAWFQRILYPEGYRYFHSGSGSAILPLDGVDHEWTGVANPRDGQLAGIGQITFPRWNIASVVRITLASMTKAFYSQVINNRKGFEGAKADLYFAVLDQETGQLETDLVNLFPGKLTSAKTLVEGKSIREITVNMASEWEAGDFSPGDRWTPADHGRKYPGDKGLEYSGHEVDEYWS